MYYDVGKYGQCCNLKYTFLETNWQSVIGYLYHLWFQYFGWIKMWLESRGGQITVITTYYIACFWNVVFNIGGLREYKL